MKQFRAVVVGTGFIGPVHVEGLRRAGVDVAGIVGTTPAKSQQAAERLGLATGYASLEAVLKDATIDVVHLATPNQLHFSQAKAVLASGKHVLCEKPLAMNSRESAELVRMASDSGLAAAVAYNIRFYPLCTEAATQVQQGSVGDIYHVHGSYVQDWLSQPSDFNWRVLAESGGQLRAVADIGTHWLDLIQFICGQPVVAVCADLRTVFQERMRPSGPSETFSEREPRGTACTAVPISTEDCGTIMLRFANGANGCLWVSQVTSGRKNCLRFEIAGSQRSLAWNSEQPNELWIGHRQQANQTLLRDPALLGNSAKAITSYPGGHNEGFADTFKQLFRVFYASIATGQVTAPLPYPTFADGHREILLCEAVLRSHQERGWVELPPGHGN